MSARLQRAAVQRQRALARDVRVERALAEDPAGAPLGGVAGEAGEIAAEVGAPGGADRRVVGGDGEAAGLGVDRPRPGPAHDRASVAVGEPVVPDRGAVLLDRAGRQRCVEAVAPAPHVAQVVVDAVVDLVLHPDRGRLGEPGVLVGVVAELEDVVVLMGERHLEVAELRRAGELGAGVVVVEHQVPMQPAGHGVPARDLAAVRRRVAEERAPDLHQVDVGLAPAARPRCRRTSGRASRACRSPPSRRVRRRPGPARRSRGSRCRCGR